MVGILQNDLIKSQLRFHAWSLKARFKSPSPFKSQTRAAHESLSQLQMIWVISHLRRWTFFLGFLRFWFHIFRSFLCFIMLLRHAEWFSNVFEHICHSFFPPFIYQIGPKSPIITHHFTKAPALFYRFTHRVITNCFLRHENIVFPLISYLYCLQRPLRLAAAHSVKDAQTR